MDGQRYRHVLCRTGHSNSLQDVLVEDSAWALLVGNDGQCCRMHLPDIQLGI